MTSCKHALGMHRKCTLTPFLLKMSLYLACLLALLPSRTFALNYDFLIGSIELENNYKITSSSTTDKAPFYVVASKELTNPNGKIVITTMVHDYTERHNIRISEDNAFEYLVQYLRDNLVAQNKSLNITKITDFHKTTVNNNLGVNALFFASTPDNTNIVSIVTVTYSEQYIVAFIVTQSGRTELGDVLSAIDKFESYKTNGER